jgi:hypothetical protein
MINEEGVTDRSGFRRNDENAASATFFGSINVSIYNPEEED